MISPFLRNLLAELGVKTAGYLELAGESSTLKDVRNDNSNINMLFDLDLQLGLDYSV